MLPLYIDPGTGSMLISLFIGLATTAVFGARILYSKFKYVFTGEKTKNIEITNNEKIVIFSDHKRYWNVFKPICDEFEKRQIPISFYTASFDDPALNANYKFIKTEFLGEGNIPYLKLNKLNADIVLATTPGLDVYQWKRSKNVKWYVHIPHSIDDVPATYRMFGLDYYDAVLTSGNHQEKVIRKLEELRNIPKKEIICVGSTYLDSMKIKKEQITEKEEKKEKPLILLAPTWGINGILSKFGNRFIDALIKTGYDIVIRPHPQSLTAEKVMLDKLKNDYPQILWNFDNDNFNILNKSDVMISDFSGVIYDYSLIFNKPVIYTETEYDTMPFDADWLDEKIWSIRVLPKVGIKLEERDFSKLKEVIDEVFDSQSIHNSRGEVKAEAWCHEGKCSKLTVDYLESCLKKL